MSKEEIESKIKELDEMINNQIKVHKLDEESTSSYTKMMKDPVELRAIKQYWENKLK